MLEYYFPEAVVLAKDSVGEADSRVFLYAKDFGKLVAKARSARKITSKLSSHLEPGNLIQVRLVEKNGLQVVDALKTGKVEINFPDLFFLNEVLHEADYDLAVWGELTANCPSTQLGASKSQIANHDKIEPKFSWTKVLKILGWDPEQASCGICKRNKPYSFNINEQSFICENCVFDTESLPKNFWGREVQFIKI
ncbi:MAG: recombination protein O N-terminal domain-containing protein [Candidatus Paceibacterota bacterium]